MGHSATYCTCVSKYLTSALVFFRNEGLKVNLKISNNLGGGSVKCRLQMIAYSFKGNPIMHQRTPIYLQFVLSYISK